MTAADASSFGVLCCQIGESFALSMIKLIEQVKLVYSVLRYATAHIAVGETQQKICKVDSFFSLNRNRGISMLETFVVYVMSDFRVASKLR